MGDMQVLEEPLKTGVVVWVGKEHLTVYGYRGTETSFKVLGSEADNYSRVYTLEDSEGVLLRGVYAEDVQVL